VYSSFSFADTLILIVYLIIVLSIGFYYSRKDKNTSEYFLGGRNIGWIAVGISIFATNISSEHFVGLAGSGAARGLAVGQFELMAIFILIILGWIIAPIYMKSGVTTMPEFLEKRFDARSRKFFATFSIVLYLLTKVTVTIFAGGLLFYAVFGITIYTSAIIIVLLTGIYVVTGGSTAIFKTHLFQGAIMILGAVVLTIFGLYEVGGFTGLKAKLPADYFNMFKSASDPDYPWTGIIFGAPIIAFWYWCTDQYIVQRVISAKSINDARRGSLLAAFLKILPVFILVLPGLIAAAIFPDIKGDSAFPTLLASDILPMGIKGFVVAGLLAAIMSSLASVFNTSSVLFTNDFYKPRHPEASETKLVLIGRLSTMVFVVAAILCVPFVKIISSEMYLFMQSVQGFLSPPVAAVFIFGLLSKKVNAKGAIWTLILGELIGVSKLIAALLVDQNLISSPLLLYYAQINFLHFAIFLFLFSSITIIVISLVTHKQENKVQYLFTDSLHEIRFNLSNPGILSDFKTNIILSAFILLLIIGLWSIWY
jgi:SSS family solute:Na+ symporter